jgi:hypothetical protein
MDNENQNSAHVDSCEHVALVEGDVVSLGSSQVTDGRGRVLTAIYEAEVVTGEHGERLERAQAAAIREVLTYLASLSDEPGDDGERDPDGERP